MNSRGIRTFSTSLGGRSRSGRASIAALVVAVSSVVALPAMAGDVTWTNGSTNFMWDTSSANWNTGTWNNAGGDGAIFTAAGVGAITVPGPINVNSFDFQVDGYTLTGPGPLNIVNGLSTQTTGVANVAAGATAKLFVPVNSSLGFQKVGQGTLELNSPGSYFGGIGLDGRSTLKADLLVGGWQNAIPSGTLRVNSGSVIPASTRVSISDGYLDIGSNNVTLSELIFPNQNDPVVWNPSINAAACGVIGNGTLRVLGDINVIGVTGGNFSSNSIAANLDMGGGTQVVRIGSQNSFGLSASLQFTGSISNGSLFKSIGTQSNGVQAAQDGMGLFANNTYTGATIFNMGENVVTGTNASTSVKMAGQPAAANTSTIKLQGANGSFQSATLLQAFAGGTIALDNNAAIAAGGSQPPTPAAQNNNRIRDDAEVQLRDGNFIYRGLSTAAASETLGSLNVLGGNNVVTITPNGVGGTATVTVDGPLSLASRATMVVSSTTLSAASKMFINGSMPAADGTGILPRMVGSSDFLTYSAVTGLTPYTGYSLNTFTPGTNVSLTAASTVVSSVTINALKRGTSSFTTTIAAGQTLGISSGMILNTGGTATLTGGTIDFGSTPGVFFGGTDTISSAITGSAGLINANATVTLSGDLSGLTGTITNDNPATTNLTTNTFAGSLELRGGFLNINTSQTLAGQGPITIGVPQNDANMVGLLPSLNISGAGANAIIGRDIIVDNGSTNAAGVALRYSLVPGMTPLGNTTGSQTVSGNITLNTSLRLQGGGGGGSGSTNFTGNVSGAGTFFVPNGRANFSGTVSNAGGFNIGDQGFTAKITFSGTGSGSGPITISGGNSNTLSYTAGSLPGGAISVWNSSSGSQPQIIPLNNSTINNPIVLGIGPNPGQEGNATANVGAGIVAEWAGPMSGFSPLTKTGTGKLVLSSPTNSYTGAIAVSAGTLAVNGSLASSASVAGSAILEGTGTLGGGVTVSSNGILSPGTSIGTLTTGALSLLGILQSEIDVNNGGPATADLLSVMGTISLSSATLNLSLLNPPVPPPYVNGTYLIVANDGIDAVSGVFASILGLPAGYSATVDYSYLGTDTMGRIGDGNDIAVVLTPEPTAIGLLALAMLGVVRRRRR